MISKKRRIGHILIGMILFAAPFALVAELPVEEQFANELVDRPIPRGKIHDTIVKTLRKSISEMFSDAVFCSAAITNLPQ